MGAMFRSEEMALCQLFIQPEAAYTSVSELGETGSVQFRDLNEDVNVFQRKFVNEVRRCDEMERKLRYIESEVHKDGVRIPAIKEPPRAPNPREIVDLEAHLEKTENEISELSQNAVNLKQYYLELTELKHVLEETEAFFAAQEEVDMDSLKKSQIPDETTRAQQVTPDSRLGFVAGVIARERMPSFERMLWRITRGNIFLRHTELDKPLEDPKTGDQIYKSVFVAFLQGEQIKLRIKKVCTGFHASLYPCPPSSKERQDMVKGVHTRLADLILEPKSKVSNHQPGKQCQVLRQCFFKKRYSILLEFLPQILFLCALFLYMVFMMFYKWLAYSCTHDVPLENSQSCAPSILILFINMMLFSKTKSHEGCKEFMFEGQGSMQLVFVLVAFCCIPVMLLGKPLYILSQNKKKKSKLEQVSGSFVNRDIEMLAQTDGSENATQAPANTEPFSDVMIIQAIHTIEYVLSTISHTASYLRLWALSLAHAELSEVLWNMVLTLGLKDHGYIGAIKLYVAFAFWAFFTLAILVMMEGLSAFLHTLRLHWVEFMSKFYMGLGYIFQPFCFKTILEQEETNN
ncbi:V-type proton ATPase 116 kDa subunit a-like [Hyposmocoma kahamanoa]|uniref:V-type proton ATPase 116 kDa subunit a-like n=1 Tax=Hyposmocoma kahamanoa TaxID=1477025 RepID=UPI000E6D686F|nr:V-type proton ATPase 116 kDa subunit a-like [Hyposmocoma kahamanoa]